MGKKIPKIQINRKLKALVRFKKNSSEILINLYKITNF